MRFVIQRVQHAEVKVDGEVTGSIGKGFLVLIGVAETDTREIADKMIKKLLGLRIFEDAQGKTNLDLHAVDGELLLVSQFTLYADCKKEIVLPSSMPVNRIWRMNYMNTLLPSADRKFPKSKRYFGADMKVSLLMMVPLLYCWIPMKSAKK